MKTLRHFATSPLRHFANFVDKYYQSADGGYIDTPVGDFAADFAVDMRLRPHATDRECSLANLFASLPEDMHEYARTCWAAYVAASANNEGET